MARKKGKTITIFSTKGGVGKTMFTLNLGAVYSLLNKKVLIIDLDFSSGGIGLSLNVDQTKDIFNLVDDLNNNRYTEFQDYVIKYNDNIDILPCPRDPRQGGKIDSKYIPIIMVNCISRYDVVLIDTNHILNDINLNALDKTDEILMLLTNDPINLKNMKSITTIFKDSGINNYKVILNNSINRNKDVFSIIDIKNIINNNIDYTIDNSFYIKDIHNYILRGEMILLNNRIQVSKKKDLERFKKIALNLLNENMEGKND